MPFGKVCSRIEVGDGTVYDLHQICHPGGCSTSGEVPRRTNPGTHPSGDPGESHHWGARGYSGTRIRSPPTPQEIKEPTKELTPAEVSTEDTAPTEEPIEELATLMATVSQPAEEPDIPPVWHEEREKGEVPWSNFPGWIDVLHPTQPVIPSGWNPLTISELRWWCHSQSVGRRRAQHQWAEEHKWAMQETSDLTSSPGSPKPRPKITLPPDFKGVVACLLQDSPSLAPIDPPRNKVARYMDGTHSGNNVCYLHRSGWGHWGYIHGHCHCLSGGEWPLGIPAWWLTSKGPPWRTSLTSVMEQRQVATLKQSNYGGSHQHGLRLCKFIVSASVRNYYSSCGFT